MKHFYKPKMWLCIVLINIMANNSFAQNNENPIKIESYNGTEPLLVKKCKEFEITGNGSNSEWNKAEWSVLTMNCLPNKYCLNVFNATTTAKSSLRVTQ